MCRDGVVPDRQVFEDTRVVWHRLRAWPRRRCFWRPGGGWRRIRTRINAKFGEYLHVENGMGHDQSGLGASREAIDNHQDSDLFIRDRAAGSL